MDSQDGIGQDPAPEYLTIDQAAKAADMHRTSIYRLIREGKLSPVTMGESGRKMLSREEVERIAPAAKRGSESSIDTSSETVVGGGQAVRYSASTEDLIQVLKVQIQEGKEREAWLRQRLDEAESLHRETLRLLPAPVQAQATQEEGSRRGEMLAAALAVGAMLALGALLLLGGWG